MLTVRLTVRNGGTRAVRLYGTVYTITVLFRPIVNAYYVLHILFIYKSFITQQMAYFGCL